jgi:uncharacterized membrane protein YcaP (DUF421 family)
MYWAQEAFGLSLKAEDLQFWQVAMRGVLIYAALIVTLRLAKKRSLGRATALDVVIVITIGSLASRGITGNAPLGNSLAAVMALLAVHWFVSLVTRDHSTISDWIKGRPRRIIMNGEVDEKAVVAAHMSDDDLAEDLRQQGVEDPKEVKLAMLERSGQLSVIRYKR